jgi:hypothetical protein
MKPNGVLNYWSIGLKSITPPVQYSRNDFAGENEGGKPWQRMENR